MWNADVTNAAMQVCDRVYMAYSSRSLGRSERAVHAWVSALHIAAHSCASVVSMAENTVAHFRRTWPPRVTAWEPTAADTVYLYYTKQRRESTLTHIGRVLGELRFSARDNIRLTTIVTVAAENPESDPRPDWQRFVQLERVQAAEFVDNIAGIRSVDPNLEYDVVVAGEPVQQVDLRAHLQTVARMLAVEENRIARTGGATVATEERRNMLKEEMVRLRTEQSRLFFERDGARGFVMTDFAALRLNTASSGKPSVRGMQRAFAQRVAIDIEARGRAQLGRLDLSRDLLETLYGVRDITDALWTDIRTWLSPMTDAARAAIRANMRAVADRFEGELDDVVDVVAGIALDEERRAGPIEAIGDMRGEAVQLRFDGRERVDPRDAVVRERRAVVRAAAAPHDAALRARLGANYVEKMGRFVQSDHDGVGIVSQLDPRTSPLFVFARLYEGDGDNVREAVLETILNGSRVVDIVNVDTRAQTAQRHEIGVFPIVEVIRIAGHASAIVIQRIVLAQRPRKPPVLGSLSLTESMLDKRDTAWRKAVVDAIRLTLLPRHIWRIQESGVTAAAARGLPLLSLRNEVADGFSAVQVVVYVTRAMLVRVSLDIHRLRLALQPTELSAWLVLPLGVVQNAVRDEMERIVAQIVLQNQRLMEREEAQRELEEEEERDRPAHVQAMEAKREHVLDLERRLRMVQERIDVREEGVGLEETLEVRAVLREAERAQVEAEGAAEIIPEIAAEVLAEEQRLANELVEENVRVFQAQSEALNEVVARLTAEAAELEAQIEHDQERVLKETLRLEAEAVALGKEEEVLQGVQAEIGEQERVIAEEEDIIQALRKNLTTVEMQLKEAVVALERVRNTPKEEREEGSLKEAVIARREAQKKVDEIKERLARALERLAKEEEELRRLLGNDSDSVSEISEEAEASKMGAAMAIGAKKRRITLVVAQRGVEQAKKRVRLVQAQLQSANASLRDDIQEIGEDILDMQEELSRFLDDALVVFEHTKRRTEEVFREGTRVGEVKLAEAEAKLEIDLETLARVVNVAAMGNTESGVTGKVTLAQVARLLQNTNSAFGVVADARSAVSVAQKRLVGKRDERVKTLLRLQKEKADAEDALKVARAQLRKLATLSQETRVSADLSIRRRIEGIFDAFSGLVSDILSPDAAVRFTQRVIVENRDIIEAVNSTQIVERAEDVVEAAWQANNGTVVAATSAVVILVVTAWSAFRVWRATRPLQQIAAGADEELLDALEEELRDEMRELAEIHEGQAAVWARLDALIDERADIVEVIRLQQERLRHLRGQLAGENETQLTPGEVATVLRTAERRNLVKLLEITQLSNLSRVKDADLAFVPFWSLRFAGGVSKKTILMTNVLRFMLSDDMDLRTGTLVHPWMQTVVITNAVQMDAPEPRGWPPNFKRQTVYLEWRD